MRSVWCGISVTGGRATRVKIMSFKKKLIKNTIPERPVLKLETLKGSGWRTSEGPVDTYEGWRRNQQKKTRQVLWKV